MHFTRADKQNCGFRLVHLETICCLHLPLRQSDNLRLPAQNENELEKKKKTNHQSSDTYYDVISEQFYWYMCFNISCIQNKIVKSHFC